VVQLTIHEGKKHQVKRMLKAIGHEVVRLHRDSFGPLELTGLMPGEWRPLTAEERSAIEALASPEAAGAEKRRARPPRDTYHKESNNA
jgi:23S rRNA pseudouridine2605 synthase